MTRSVDNKHSRYVQGGETTTLENRIGWWERREIPLAEDDIRFVITVKYHKRPDLLAYDVYGRASLIWLVLQYNNILDDKTEFIEGKELRLPTRDRVFLDILNKQTGGVPK